jgi:hypothetical protein
VIRAPRLHVALLVALAAAGCGREHVLGSTSSSSSGSGGAGGAPSSSSAGSGGAPATSSSGGTGGAGGSIVEPAGDTKLTIVNGIIDYPAIRLCFLPGDAPWPADAAGLPFAGSAVVASISSALPTSADVTPWVIAGDLTQTAGKTCAQILAVAGANADGGPPLVARALAVIPSLVWDSHRSLLLVPDGCLGGPGHDDPSAKLACGQGYTPATPTAGVTLVGMSRLQSSNVSLQAASASPALPELDVSLVPNLMGAMPVVVAPALSPGAIGPKPPFTALTLNGLGPLDGVQIQTFAPGTTTASSTTLFSDVFAHGGPGGVILSNGDDATLVAVGAAPGLPTAQWWHALTFALVASDP